MVTSKSTRVLSLFAGLLLVAAGCGQRTVENVHSQGANLKLGSEVEIPIKFGAGAGLGLVGSGTGFELAAATSYTMNLTGCVSGLNGTFSGSTVKVYLTDRSCVVKLVSFVFNGNTYNGTTSGATDFASFAASSTATFANTTNSADKYTVTVGNQLSSPVVDTDTVSYTFDQASAGSIQTVGNGVTASNNGFGQSVSVTGQDAPAFVLSTNNNTGTGPTGVLPVVFKGVDASGNGYFQFNVFCSTPMTGSGLSSLCGQDVALSAINYKLVLDTYGVATGTALTLAQLATIMSSGTSTIASGDVLTTGNKGFNIPGPGGAGLSIPGSNPIQSNLNYVLVLAVGSAPNQSYTYIGVDVTAISNP